MKIYLSDLFVIIILCLVILCIVPSAAARRVDLIGKLEDEAFLREGGPDFLYGTTPDKWTAEMDFDTDRTLAYTRYPEKLKMKKSDGNQESTSDIFAQDVMGFYTRRPDRVVAMDLNKYMFSISPDNVNSDNEAILGIAASDNPEELDTQQYTIDLARVQKHSGMAESNLFLEIFFKILDFLYLKIGSFFSMLNQFFGF